VVRDRKAVSGAGALGTRSRFPALDVSVVMKDLDIPWDVAVLPSGSWLVTERDRLTISLRRPDGSRIVLAERPPGFWASGETGLMSISVDPQVRSNGRFYTCTGFRAAGGPEVRVVAWRLNDSRTAARRVGPLLSGIQTTSGRHGGCRIRFDPAGAMWVGTGDAAVGTNAQDLTSLNGKVLRLNRFTGKPWPTNPWPNAASRHKRFIYTYGHRNVQGLAWRPGDTMWSVEHGTYRDDEVNRDIKGANYGWDPGPGYDESTPMTDYSLPGRQIGARWSSGDPTIATSGATWVAGAQWGQYRGTLAVGALAGQRLLFLRFGADNRLIGVRTPPVLAGDYGRLRSVVQAKSGALLVTTGNGGGNDVILKVTPR
jgi:glucose/arabinose dehydrogenase